MPGSNEDVTTIKQAIQAGAASLVSSYVGGYTQWYGSAPTWRNINRFVADQFPNLNANQVRSVREYAQSSLSASRLLSSADPSSRAVFAAAPSSGTGQRELRVIARVSLVGRDVRTGAETVTHGIPTEVTVSKDTSKADIVRQIIENLGSPADYISQIARSPRGERIISMTEGMQFQFSDPVFIATERVE